MSFEKTPTTIPELPASTEFREHKSDHVADVCEYFTFKNDVLSDPAIRRDYFANIGPLDFLDEIQRIRSLIETGDSSQLHPYDSQDVSTGSLIPPDYREKEALLLETWEAVRSILNNYKIPDDEALEKSAIVTGIMLLVIHPFGDGNGRTSRLVSYMLAQGLGTKNDIEEILSSEGSKYWTTISYTEAAPLGKGENNTQLTEYLSKYTTDSERTSPLHPEETTSFENTVSTEMNWRKHQAALCCAFLDLIEENPQVPLSSDFTDANSRITTRVHRLKECVDNEAYSIKDIQEIARTHLAVQVSALQGLEASVSVLGESMFTPGKTYSVLDQLVAYHHLRSIFWRNKFNQDKATQNAKKIYKNITTKTFPSDENIR